MDKANERVKQAVGWPAYVLSGARALRSPSVRTEVHADPEPPIRARARSVIVGNCGTLTGGVELMPDAVLDDGLLDAVVLAPHGLAGWLAVARDVVTGRGRSSSRLSRRQADQVVVRLSRPTPTQIDGDGIGEKRLIRYGVLPKALTVRVAQPDAAD